VLTLPKLERSLFSVKDVCYQPVLKTVQSRCSSVQYVKKVVHQTVLSRRSTADTRPEHNKCSCWCPGSNHHQTLHTKSGHNEAS